MKKKLLLLMLVLLTSCEGYQAVVYSYGIRQRPEPQHRPQPVRFYPYYYTPYNYTPIVTPVYVYPSNNHHSHYTQGGRRR